MTNYCNGPQQTTNAQSLENGAYYHSLKVYHFVTTDSNKLCENNTTVFFVFLGLEIFKKNKTIWNISNEIFQAHISSYSVAWSVPPSLGKNLLKSDTDYNILSK